MILIAVVCALFLLVMSAFLIDGSIYKFVERLQTALLFASYVGAGHTVAEIFRIDEFQLNDREKISMLVVAMLAFVGTISLVSEKKFFRAIAIIITIFFLGIVISLVFSLDQETAGLSKFQGLMIWAVVFPSVIMGALRVCPRNKIVLDI